MLGKGSNLIFWEYPKVCVNLQTGLRYNGYRRFFYEKENNWFGDAIVVSLFVVRNKLFEGTGSPKGKSEDNSKKWRSDDIRERCYAKKNQAEK